MPPLPCSQTSPTQAIQGSDDDTHDRVDLDWVLHRAHPADLNRRHVEDVHAGHVSKQLVTLDTGRLLVVGRDLLDGPQDSCRPRERGVNGNRRPDQEG